MKDYIRANKRAWEDAYEHSKDAFKDIVTPLRKNPSHFIPLLLRENLDIKDITNKSIAQLACNNGREILSLGMTYNAKHIAGFDLAENMIEAAKKSARELDVKASFYAGNVLDIDASLDASFDTIFVLIGVLFWFESMSDFFATIHRLLKPGGRLYLLEGHPVTNMFAFEGEPEYDASRPFSPAHSYFKTTPFIDNDGMTYMSDEAYESPAFVSHVHTLESIMQSLLNQGFSLNMFKEDNTNYLNTFPELDGGNVPLVFLLKATR